MREERRGEEMGGEGEEYRLYCRIWVVSTGGGHKLAEGKGKGKGKGKCKQVQLPPKASHCTLQRASRFVSGQI